MDAARPGTAGADTSGADAVEARLDDLQRESELRRRELRDLAALLPEVTSRRAVVSSMVASVVHAPDKPLVAKRVGLKVLRTPGAVFRRLGKR